MASICIHFSDFFNIESSLLKEYGAFDVSLVADVPVFIDPFCLYASDKEKYNELHTYSNFAYARFLYHTKTTQGIISGCHA